MFKLEYLQYIPYIPMLTNTGQYSQIHTNTDIYRQIPTNTYNTYYYLLIQTSTYHTYQYIPYCALVCTAKQLLPAIKKSAAKLLALANLNRTVHLPTYNKLIREDSLALRV